MLEQGTRLSGPTTEVIANRPKPAHAGLRVSPVLTMVSNKQLKNRSNTMATRKDINPQDRFVRPCYDCGIHIVFNEDGSKFQTYNES